ncbi:uncharacterized protein B0T15DRAFT_548299 [Chaetomium strumarium]|uniref:Uncharacterized protein n=1 Tax=Chaetomium strumarium TaxID=1170767 RepID=A0AAJ0H3E9_9PEZI|nr:hypothetical protein B0T15DRAFT_548299 [Chaetomium strumarium]
MPRRKRSRKPPPFPALPPEKLQPPGGGPERFESEFTHEELLWLYRTKLEQNHRYQCCWLQIERSYGPSMDKVEPHLGQMGQYGLDDRWYQSVPMYFLGTLRHRWYVVRILIEKYIYKRWFRPYRSAIELGQYLMFISPKGVSSPDSPPSRSVVEYLLAMNKAVCANAEKYAQEALRSELGSGEQIAESTPSRSTRMLNPLVKVIIMIVYPDTIGSLPVYLVRTGVEEGLSAPISFDSISDKVEPQEAEGVVKTNLETAIDFVMALDAREEASFGPQPDLLGIAARHYRDEGADKLTTLPSS